MSALEIRRIGLGSEGTDYEEMWALQRELHADRAAGVVDDTVLFLEHAPVFTAGTRTEGWERPTDGSRVVDIDRGGNITFTGPASWWATRSSRCRSTSSSWTTYAASRRP